jgi:hypothetical protein
VEFERSGMRTTSKSQIFPANDFIPSHTLSRSTSIYVPRLWGSNKISLRNFFTKNMAI